MERLVVIGTGAALPERVVTNDELAQSLDTSDQWIVERTGIRQRHLARTDERTSDLAIQAARAALADANASGESIEAIILATATPDLTFPATAVRVQQAIGARNAFAMDVQAVCSGFVYGLTVADGLAARQQAKRFLVIGAETFSRILDWTDRSTCVLFGDGAGAFVLETQTSVDDQGRPRGMLSAHLRSDGVLHDLLYVDGGPSQTGGVGKLRMAGNQVFKHAVVKLSESIVEAVTHAGYQLDDVDWFVPHQANQRILLAVADRLGLDSHKVISTVAQHANTSAASIPLALDLARRDGRICEGDLVVVEALGGGMTWGAAVIRM